MIIRFVFGPKHNRCSYCGGAGLGGLVFVEGGIVHEGKFLWRYRGVIHQKCIGVMRKEKMRELQLETTV